MSKKLTALEKARRAASRKLSKVKPPKPKPISLPATAKNLNRAAKKREADKARARANERLSQARTKYRAEIAAIRNDRDLEIARLKQARKIATRISNAGNKSKIKYASLKQLQNQIATSLDINFDGIPSKSDLIEQAALGHQGIRVTVPYTYADYYNTIIEAQTIRIFSSYFVTISYIDTDLEHKALEGLVRITNIYTPDELGLEHDDIEEDDELEELNLLDRIFRKYAGLKDKAAIPVIVAMTIYLKFDKSFENKHRVKP